MEKLDVMVLVAWLDPRPDREKGVTFGFVSTVRPTKSAQNLIGRLTLQNYRFSWSYIFDENQIDEISSELFNELTKGVK